ncbi:hypothetical protein TNCV_5031091 [Trichonephila clavipes]|nr:hypothetical protein TNCV_5031091 [Trichonephila clavipes]
MKYVSSFAPLAKVLVVGLCGRYSSKYPTFTFSLIIGVQFESVLIVKTTLLQSVVFQVECAKRIWRYETAKVTRSGFLDLHSHSWSYLSMVLTVFGVLVTLLTLMRTRHRLCFEFD